MSPSFGRVLLPLLFAGACSFPEYAFAPPDKVSTCDDGVLGKNETGIDCGGVCKACPMDTPTATCEDSAQGKNETDIDCGGACPDCTVGERCSSGDDCDSGSCTASICQAPLCNDQVENGAESDIDCGGRCPELCDTDARCTSESDCASGVCTGSVCQAPTCSDKISNGMETGPDCGGKCKLCANGEACRAAADCVSNSCDATQRLCVDPGCQDGTQNVNETDVDCGGTSCAPCGPTLRCKVNSDCDSLLCDAASKRCDTASCSDAIVNQDESDINCGGTICAKCANFRVCKVAADCASGECQSKECLPAKMGATLDQSGWVATASNTFGDSMANYLIDGSASNRWTSGTKQATGMWIEVDMAKPQYFFTVTLDAKEWPADAGKNYNIYFSLDGTFSTGWMKTYTSTKSVQPVVSSETLIYARYVKVELTSPGSEWWSVGEMSITQ